jgi:hypothetical protein
VDGAPKEKDAWENGDIIYIQVNGGDWTYIKYTDDGWNTDNVSISKGDSYKAVYAPNYKIVNGNLVLATDEDGNAAIGSTGEYLVNTGVSLPIDIEFTRPYSRLRIYLGKSATEENTSDDATSANATTNPIELTFGEGFTTNDGTEPGTIQLVPDEEGNAYVYGSWKDGTKLEITSNIQGNPTDNAVYVAKSISDNIAGKSVEGTSYAVDYANAETWVIDNLDHANAAAISDWSSFSGYTNLKVVGTWNSTKAPVLKMVFDSTNSSKTIAPFTRIDLSSVTGLTTIPENFFNANSNVKQVDLPETITEIGNDAFASCSSLYTLNLPDGITTFGNYAFMSCESLTIDKLPKYTTTIGDYAFLQCIIAFSTMPNVTSIADGAFSNCTFTNDASFEWPSTINKISTYAFISSTLKSVTIPENVTKINDFAFMGCQKLTTIIFRGNTAPTIGSSAFYYTTPKNITIYVPEGSKSSYEENGWSQIGTIVEQ